MAIFSFSNDLPIHGFINTKGITLLQIIHQNDNISSSRLIGKIELLELFSINSLFQYLKCFRLCNIIKKTKRKRDKDNSFVRYSLTQEGEKLLEIFLNNF
ncbi:hypothetical protein LCGC14_1874480 [marine sediment metagenome]|uniref:ArnR1-like winged helix-turn-helix domain-containing protein n=1 Tax=marine sediment metagenome TaxID=412755 RepID=A0A0F9J2R8_9ZZZZ